MLLSILVTQLTAKQYSSSPNIGFCPINGFGSQGSTESPTDETIQGFLQVRKELLQEMLVLYKEYRKLYSYKELMSMPDEIFCSLHSGLLGHVLPNENYVERMKQNRYNFIKILLLLIVSFAVWRRAFTQYQWSAVLYFCNAYAIFNCIINIPFKEG